jgi:hypothetical protein
LLAQIKIELKSPQDFKMLSLKGDTHYFKSTWPFIFPHSSQSKFGFCHLQNGHLNGDSDRLWVPNLETIPVGFSQQSHPPRSNIQHY